MYLICSSSDVSSALLSASNPKELPGLVIFTAAVPLSSHPYWVDQHHWISSTALIRDEDCQKGTESHAAEMINQPTNHPTNQLTNELTNQVINQPTIRPTPRSSLPVTPTVVPKPSCELRAQFDGVRRVAHGTEGHHEASLLGPLHHENLPAEKSEEWLDDSLEWRK